MCNGSVSGDQFSLSRASFGATTAVSCYVLGRTAVEQDIQRISELLMCTSPPSTRSSLVNYVASEGELSDLLPVEIRVSRSD